MTATAKPHSRSVDSSRPAVSGILLRVDRSSLKKIHGMEAEDRVTFLKVKPPGDSAHLCSSQSEDEGCPACASMKLMED